MAAGIGSRYGDGLKQLAAVGPNGEVLMEYAIYDAVEAGYEQIIFVIREDIRDEFHSKIGSKLQGRVKADYAFQRYDDLPPGYKPKLQRTKPWGTGQAVWAARDLIDSPFSVINADDYYGKESFTNIRRFLVENQNHTDRLCMAGFMLENTLSESGGVTRGVCTVDDRGFLTDIVETSGIKRAGDGRIISDAEGDYAVLAHGAYASMNMWGFSPQLLSYLEDGFKLFLDKHINDPKAEFLLPCLIGDTIHSGKASVKVLPTSEKWYGMTYKEDTEAVRQALQKMISAGRYPDRLWA